MAASAPIRSRRPRPTREEILEARETRRRRFAYFVASIVWAVLVGLVFMLHGEGIVENAGWVLACLLPAVGLGLAAGRRMWPAYFATAFVCGTFSVGVPFMLTVVAMSVSVVLLGYGYHVLDSWRSGRSVSRPPEREATDPRGVATPVAPVGAKRGSRLTVANAAPSTRAFRKSWR